MKICIYGLGAIGGLFAARLSESGHEVSAVARGETLAAVAQHGLTLYKQGSVTEIDRRVPLRVTDDPAELGPQDWIIITVKSTALPAIAEQIAPLLGAETRVLSAMNGVPWWFFSGLPEAPGHIALPSVDPGRKVSAAIDASRVIGCVTYLSASSPAPGSVSPIEDRKIIVGDAVGKQTDPALAIGRALRDAGFDVTDSDHIQRDIWFKLWGNMTVNPISAIAGATGDRILSDEYVRAFMSRAMRESAAVGAKIGIAIDDDPESRHALTAQLGAFKTSMLQDVEANKPIELDALVGAVLDIARAVNVDVPNIETLFGLARLFARQRGLYPEAFGE
ncbi:MAG: 2-dehydropantoate 2-reductase [Saccharospirillum sp.]|uniref:2-dehydropantoate 2-reductase n=1 Tax=Saccharospirillum sp. TaxID=2033801 RepID=UPI0032986AC5